MVVHIHILKVTDWLAFFQACWKESGENCASHICKWSKCDPGWIMRLLAFIFNFCFGCWYDWRHPELNTELLGKKSSLLTCMQQNFPSLSPNPHNCPDHEFYLNRDYNWELNVSTSRLLLKAKRLSVLQGNSSGKLYLPHWEIRASELRHVRLVREDYNGEIQEMIY